MRAYDVRTGRLRWTFHVVPQEGDPALKTWKGDSWRYTGAGNVWSLMSADDELGFVYLPTTSMTNDMYGGHRLGNTLYATSVVCVEAATGKKVWHYQTVHHDLFDYDNPAAPILVDLTVDGKPIKAVAQITKQSFVPTPNLVYNFTWDGKDGYGRRLVGEQEAIVQIENILLERYEVPQEFSGPSIAPKWWPSCSPYRA